MSFPKIFVSHSQKPSTKGNFLKTITKEKERPAICAALRMTGKKSDGTPLLQKWIYPRWPGFGGQAMSPTLLPPSIWMDVPVIKSDAPE